LATILTVYSGLEYLWGFKNALVKDSNR